VTEMMLTPTEQQAMDYYTQKRQLTDQVAAGILGVLSYESKLNPLAENNTGTDAGGVINGRGAFGLAQWNGPRQKNLQLFAQKYYSNLATPWTDLTVQLAFVLTEAAGFSDGSAPAGYPRFWAAITNPATTYQDLITVMVQTYEAPANPAPEISGANTTAQQLITQYTPMPSTTHTGEVASQIPPQASATSAAAQTSFGALVNATQALLTELQKLMGS
jgi:Phage tail lysozyme